MSHPTEPGAPPAPTDAELLDAWRGGDAAALDALVRRHQQPVHRLLLRATGDRATADDLAQKTFLRALRRLSSLRRGDAFRAWLFRIALNLVRNRRRGLFRWRHAEVETLDRRPPSAADPDAGLVREETRARLREAIDGLPRLQREVVRLRLQAELPFKEIALVLETTEASAKVSYHHAVRAQRARLEQS